MKTILSFLFVFTAVAGSAQQCHEFIIRTESVASNSPGSGVSFWCWTGDSKDDDTKYPSYKNPPDEPFYITLYKPYKFIKATIETNGVVTSTANSVSDTLLAFTKFEGQNMRNRIFIGEYKEKGKAKVLKVRLAQCETTRDADGNEVFYVCKECLEPKVKKGFFAWMGRLFG